MSIQALKLTLGFESVCFINTFIIFIFLVKEKADVKSKILDSVI